MYITKKLILSVLVVALLCFSYSTAHADVILDTFDSPSGGHTGLSTSGVDIPGFVALGASAGDAKRELTGPNISANVSPGQLVLNAGTQEQFRYGTRSFNSPTSPELNNDWTGFDGLQFDFDSVAANSTVQVIVGWNGTAGVLNSDSANQSAALPITAGSGTSLVVPWATIGPNVGSNLSDIDSLLVVLTAGSGGNLVMDQVSLDGASVPEPSSFALAAFGLAGLGWFGVRRRRQA